MPVWVALTRASVLMFIRNWPEALYIVLVMVSPLCFAYGMAQGTFLGFLGILILGMGIGVLIWGATVLVACSISERKQPADHKSNNGEPPPAS